MACPLMRIACAAEWAKPELEPIARNRKNERSRADPIAPVPGRSWELCSDTPPQYEEAS